MIDIKVPTVGESISEVTLLKWTKPNGAWVERDEVIAELESEKATFEINAEQAGVLIYGAQEGDTLKIGDIACQIDETAPKPEGAAAPAPAAEAPKKEEIKSRTDRERMAVVLFKDKTAIPMSVTQNFSDGDTIKVDKIYYDTNDYYIVNQRTFPGKQDTKSTKVDLKSQNLFFTNDADIVSYNLTAAKKN